eukprot:5036527-Pleurochrysis_carterae.AAC.1
MTLRPRQTLSEASGTCGLISILRCARLTEIAPKSRLAVIVGSSNEGRTGNVDVLREVARADGVVEHSRAGRGDGAHVLDERERIVVGEVHQETLEQPKGRCGSVKARGFQVGNPPPPLSEFSADNMATTDCERLVCQQRLLHVKDGLLVNLEDVQVAEACHAICTRVHSSTEYH